MTDRPPHLVVPVDLGPRSYEVMIGPGLIARAGSLIAPLLRRPRVAVVTDETVAALHGPVLQAALAGAGASVALVLLLAGPRGDALALILAGVAISALAGALTSLVLNLSPNPFAANEIVFWMMGSLADRSMLHVCIAAPIMAAGGHPHRPDRPCGGRSAHRFG